MEDFEVKLTKKQFESLNSRIREGENQIVFLSEENNLLLKKLDSALKQVENATLLCNAIKSVIENFKSLRERKFEHLKESDMIDLLIQAINSYVELYLVGKK